jgi:2-polyprenyl-3-methyl-5-hydroxy-6-metoxy-1,4-benzoquinol methylase
MADIVICDVCGSDKLTFDKKCFDYTVSHETFTLLNCSACGVLITSPRPDNQQLSKYYLSENYISHSNKGRSLIDKVYLLARRITIKRKVKLISQFGISQGKVLDYGCGTGEFLKACKQKSWRVTGIEPSALAREKAKTLTKEKIVSSFEEINNPPFDIITMWHVLEHVPDLNTALKNIHSSLNNNGTLIIAVPNHESYDAKHYGEYWAGYDTPRHLWHFNQQSMRKLLANNSLDLINILPMKLDAFYVSMLSEKYKHGKDAGLKGMTMAFIYGFISNFKASTSGNYSSLIYIVQKK